MGSAHASHCRPRAGFRCKALLACSLIRNFAHFMTVTCPACSSEFKFDDTRLADLGAKSTCLSCVHLFVVPRPQVDPVTVKDSWPDDAPAESSAV